MRCREAGKARFPASRLTADDPHPNDAGYRLLAGAIARVMVRRHLMRV